MCEREGDGLAGIEVARRRRHRRIVGAVVSMMTPLTVSGRPVRAQRIAGEVGDRAGDRRRLQRGGVLTGRRPCS